MVFYRICLNLLWKKFLRHQGGINLENGPGHYRKSTFRIEWILPSYCSMILLQRPKSFLPIDCLMHFSCSAFPLIYYTHLIWQTKHFPLICKKNRTILGVIWPLTWISNQNLTCFMSNICLITLPDWTVLCCKHCVMALHSIVILRLIAKLIQSLCWLEKRFTWHS